MPAVQSVKDAWDESQKYPPAQIHDLLARWFTSDPSTWVAGAEKVALSTSLSTILVVSGLEYGIGAVAPFLAPIVGAVAEITVEAINNFLGSLFGSDSTYCEHPEWRTKAMDDPLWIHYPRRMGLPAQGNTDYSVNGVPCAKYAHNGDPNPAGTQPPTCLGYLYGGVEHPGWGKLGLKALTPDDRDYPWIGNLETSLRINFPALVVLEIPPAARGSFESFWYPLYAKLKEINALQDCMRLSSADADRQDEIFLTQFVANVWNPTHAPSSNDTVFAAGAAAGDDLLLAPHAGVVHINRGPLLTDSPLLVGSELKRHATTSGGGASSGMSTGEVVFTTVAAAAGLTLLGTAAFAVKTHTPFGEVWKRIFDAIKNAATRQHKDE